MTTPSAESAGSSSLKLPGLSGIPGGADSTLRKNSSSSQLPSPGLSVSSSHLPVTSYPVAATTLPRDTAVAPSVPFDQLIPDSIKTRLSTSTNGLDKGGICPMNVEYISEFTDLKTVLNFFFPGPQRSETFCRNRHCSGFRS